MRAFQVYLLLVWLAVLAITVLAFRNQGLAAVFDVFPNDFAARDWRAQFDLDLLAHLVMLGLWAAWRHRFSPLGILIGLCCALGGSLFTYLYLFALTLQARGDMRKLVLGVHYT